MEDKAFALLEKLYIELLDTKKQLNDAKKIKTQELEVRVIKGIRSAAG